MNTPEPLTCCVVMPLGFDVRLLTNALTERGIAYHCESQPLLPRIARLGAQLSCLDLADFACVIVPPDLIGEERDDLILALGFAAGRTKPVLFFGGPSEAEALGTFGVWIGSAAFDNPAGVHYNLDRFLALAGSAFEDRAEERQPAPTAEQVVAAWRTRLDALADLPAAEAEQALAGLVGQAFEGIGARVSASETGRADVDLAVGFDGAPSDLGEPILIACEYGRLTRDRLDRAASALRPHVSGATTGIVVYHDRGRRRFENRSPEIPIVPFLAADELFQALATGTLPDTIRRKRRAVHLP